MAKKKTTKATKDDSGKVIAIISYITWIGLIIGIILNIEKKNEFAKFHIRQSLLLNIIGIVGMLVFWIPFVGWILALILLVLWIISLIGAINGEKKVTPWIGQWAHDWFKGI